VNPDEEAALVAEAVAAQTLPGEQTPAEALADFQRRLASGWYGQDETQRDLAKLRGLLDEEED